MFLLPLGQGQLITVAIKPHNLRGASFRRAGLVVAVVVLAALRLHLSLGNELIESADVHAGT